MQVNGCLASFFYILFPLILSAPATATENLLYHSVINKELGASRSTHEEDVTAHGQHFLINKIAFNRMCVHLLPDKTIQKLARQTRMSQ